MKLAVVFPMGRKRLLLEWRHEIRVTLCSQSQEIEIGMNPVEEVRAGGLQVTHCCGWWGMCGCHPALVPTELWQLAFPGAGQLSLHPLGMWFCIHCFHCHLPVQAMTWGFSPVCCHEQFQCGSWCALCNVVFWAGKYDVMYKIWSRHSSLLKYIYIYYIYTWEWALKIFWRKCEFLPVLRCILELF